MKISESLWDTAVVGGGPSGMMAAAEAAKNGVRVILLEKNDTLGRKLLITGGGRCNVTNAEMDTRKLLKKFKGSDKFLFSAFSSWSVKETLDFFHSHSVETKIENEGRVFPVSNKAKSIWDVLVANLKKYHVEVRSNSPAIGIVRDGKNVTGVKLKGGIIIKAKEIVIATGGTSRPETGSTGDAYAWLRQLGHTVSDPTPSLVPVALKDIWAKKYAGVSLSDAKITIFQNDEKQAVSKGKILFTHTGVSGPVILNMSRDIGELLKYGKVLISLDMLPSYDYGTLNSKLQEIFKENTNKKFKNCLASLVAASLAQSVVTLSGIDPEKQCNRISRQERLDLVQLLKGIPLHVDKLLGVDKAIITSGGVALEEIDFKTMRSKLFSNLYIIGDLLNIDRPSGGYSLQLCWTTGFLAGKTAAESIKDES